LKLSGKLEINAFEIYKILFHEANFLFLYVFVWPGIIIIKISLREEQIKASTFFSKKPRTILQINKKKQFV
jgi:hypothetical protein